MRQFFMMLVFVATSFSGIFSANETLAQSVITFPGDVATLEKAIERVSAGGTIRIKPGTHRIKECASIDKDVTIIAVSGNPKNTILQIDGNGIFYVKGGNVRIESLTLRSQIPRNAEPMIEPSNSPIYVSGNPKLSLIKCHITGTHGSCVWIEPEGSYCTLEECVLSGSGNCALWITNSEVICTKCQFINGQREGVEVMQGKVTLDACTISGNGSSGLSVWKDCTAIVKDCTITNNRGFGVDMSDGSSGTFKNNTLSRNREGNWSISGSGKNIVREGNRPNE